MTESKILSFRINSDLRLELKEFCARNKLSTKDVLVPCIELILESDKIGCTHTASEENTI